VESVNRKLIRPSLNEVKDQMNRRTNHQKKVAPPDQTNAENFYYMKQMQAKTRCYDQLAANLKDMSAENAVAYLQAVLPILMSW